MDNKKLGETLNDKRIGEQDLRTFVDPNKVLEAKKQKPKRTKKNSEDFYQDYSNSTDNEKILLKKEVEKQLARVDYLSYLNYVHSSIFKPTRFHKFLAAVCEKVVKQIEEGKEVRICLSVPPRHGKSMCVTETLPSWFVGRNPNSSCILTAYNADLAEKFGNKNREKIKQFGKELFNVEVSKEQDRKDLFAIKGKRGEIKSVGLSGGITGNGGRLIIIDDPYKNRADARASKQLIKEIFEDSVMSRLEGNGKGIIVIHTRWLEDDLIGELEKDPSWIIINIPCIAEENDPLKREKGETLCPELGFDEEWAKQRRADVGEDVWNALYQGHPTVENGEVFKKDFFKFYTKADLPPTFDEITQSWDCAFNSDVTSDKVCGQVWGRKGANHYLLGFINTNLSFTQTKDSIKKMTSDFNMTNKILIEKKANGSAVIETLNQEIHGIIPITPKESKYSRAVAVVPYFEAGNVYFPSVDINSRILKCVDQMLKFPNGANDDFVDATTQYLNEQRHKTQNRLLYTEDIVKIGSAIRGGIRR